MRSLLDVNVLIALLDSGHDLHDRAHLWWESEHEVLWASCPMTENAVVRIMGNPTYHSQRRFSIPTVRKQFVEFARRTDHTLFSDDISILDSSLIDHDFILGPMQITDVYLLALAVNNGARMVTLDSRISLAAVRSARAENLVMI